MTIQSTITSVMKEYEYEELLSLTVYGKLPSLKNRRRIVMVKGKPRLIKSKESMEYVKTFSAQITGDYRDCKYGSLDDDLALFIMVYYQDRRPDLSTETLHDCLEGVGLIENDRYIREIHSFGFVDRDNPRVEFKLYSRVLKV